MPKTESESQTIVDTFVAPTCNERLEILYQDDDILLVNKPSGLLSLSGKNPLNWDSVHYRLVNGQQAYSPAFPEAKLPHRLDFGTSGIMVVGLHADSLKNLNKQFQNRLVKKQYVAMLEGCLVNDAGEINASIAKDQNLFPKVEICETGKPAISKYTVMERFEQPHRCKVQLSPMTGRTHQLRIHCHSIGHPVLGCDLYKSSNSEKMADRLMLHASDLFFKHPCTNKQFHGVSNCPF